MITKEQLNTDQRKSFDQMTSSGGLTKKRALGLIQELTVDKHYTGLRVDTFKLTPEGRRVASALAEEN